MHLKIPLGQFLRTLAGALGGPCSGRSCSSSAAVPMSASSASSSLAASSMAFCASILLFRLLVARDGGVGAGCKFKTEGIKQCCSSFQGVDRLRMPFHFEIYNFGK